VIIAGDFNSTPGDKVWVAVLALHAQDFSTIVNDYCYQVLHRLQSIVTHIVVKYFVTCQQHMLRLSYELV
jgi:hypothetical protein